MSKRPAPADVGDESSEEQPSTRTKFATSQASIAKKEKGGFSKISNRLLQSIWWYNCDRVE